MQPFLAANTGEGAEKMKKKLSMFLAVLMVAGFCLFLTGGCALKEVPAGEDEPGENGESNANGPGENGTKHPGEDPGGPDGASARGNSAGNILNGGLVAMQGNHIYFSSPTDGGKLYRAGLDGSGRVKLNDDTPRYINATGEYLYYVAMGEPETVYDELMGEEYTRVIYGPIVRVNLDGGGRTVIGADPAAYLQLVGGRLYYQIANTDEPKIYRIEADGSGKELLTDHLADFFNVEGDRLYYRGVEEQPRLYGAGIDGGGRAVIYDGDAYYMNLLEDNLYFAGDIYETEFYLGGRSLYRINVSGGAASKVGDIEPAFLNCADGWLYYSKAHSGEICRVRPDGSSHTILSSDFCGGLFIFDDWLYYINHNDGNLYRMGVDGSGRLKVD